jgi:hypothetical protein
MLPALMANNRLPSDYNSRRRVYWYDLKIRLRVHTVELKAMIPEAGYPYTYIVASVKDLSS